MHDSVGLDAPISRRVSVAPGQSGAAEENTASARPFHSRWQLFTLALLALIIVAGIVFLKFGALEAWRYSSDMFTVDVMLQETLRGHFGLEYAFGSEFGDHACLVLLFLLPIKWLVGRHMVYGLLMVSPLTFVVCGAIIYGAIRAAAGARWAGLVTLLYVLAPGVIHGPFEDAYGFHADTVAGFVATALAAMLILHEQRSRNAGAARTTAAILVGLTILFCLLKEEMSLLAIGFFLLLFLLRRTRMHLAGFLIAVGIFAMQMLIIRLCQTPINRTTSHLVGLMIEQVQQRGVASVFFGPQTYACWSALLMGIIVMIACAALARRINIYAAALFLMGIAKLCAAAWVNDLDLWRWHSYPGLCMLCGAIALQSLEFRHLRSTPRERVIAPASGALIAMVMVSFLAIEVPFAFHQIQLNHDASVRAGIFKPAMDDIRGQVDKSKVVSIPRAAGAAWTAGYRYTFFPRGISFKPVGIADYLVVARTNETLEMPELTSFTLIYQNRRYRLYQRSGFTAQELAGRELFRKHFGRESLGEKSDRHAH